MNTSHTIIIGTGANTNFKLEIDNIMNNLKNNIEKNVGDFVEFATKQTEYVAKLEVKKFGFQGDLEKAIAHRVFKRKGIGEVFVQGTQEEKAKWMEEGVREHFVLNEGKMEAWVQQKAPQLINKEVIRVGGPNGNIPLGHSKNIFWKPTFNVINNDIDNMFGHYVEQIIVNS